VEDGKVEVWLRTGYQKIVTNHSRKGAVPEDRHDHHPGAKSSACCGRSVILSMAGS
jgi:hypothetical protein